MSMQAAATSPRLSNACGIGDLLPGCVRPGHATPCRWHGCYGFMRPPLCNGVLCMLTITYKSDKQLCRQCACQTFWCCSAYKGARCLVVISQFSLMPYLRFRQLGFDLNMFRHSTGLPACAGHHPVQQWCEAGPGKGCRHRAGDGALGHAASQLCSLHQFRPAWPASKPFCCA